jgi:hypothetical protein
MKLRQAIAALKVRLASLQNEAEVRAGSTPSPPLLLLLLITP